MSDHAADEQANESTAPEHQSGESQARHALPDDFSGERPLIDLSRDPHPGVPDHARPDDEG
ncbi:MAG: hypothetical protein J2O49_07575 [Sciscionella sp.]|nr:hypothetical protein [Sciscionella sp.]